MLTLWLLTCLGFIGLDYISLKPVFSNPYIEAASRLEHNAALYDYLQAGDSERFAILASAYEVRYVVVIDNSRLAVYNSPGSKLEPVFTDEGVTIYAVPDGTLSLPFPTHVNLGDKVEFLGSVVSQGIDGRSQIELYLRCIGQMEDDYTLWFHAGAGGETIALDHTLPTSEWRVGQIIQDAFALDAPPGRYELYFGLWRRQDGRRLWRMDSGDPGITLGRVEIE